MRLFLIAALTLLLKPSENVFAATPLKENILLAYCEKVSVDNFDYIFVEASGQFPGLAQVKILYRDKLVTSIFVSLVEWQEKSITLPSQGGATYRLFMNRKGWNVLKSFTDAESIHSINCSARDV